DPPPAAHRGPGPGERPASPGPRRGRGRRTRVDGAGPVHGAVAARDRSAGRDALPPGRGPLLLLPAGPSHPDRRVLGRDRSAVHSPDLRAIGAPPSRAPAPTRRRTRPRPHARAAAVRTALARRSPPRHRGLRELRAARRRRRPLGTGPVLGRLPRRTGGRASRHRTRGRPGRAPPRSGTRT